MSQKEWKRFDLAQLAVSRRITVGQAAEAAGVSKRQFRRILRSVELRGVSGVQHGLCGRRPANKLPENLVQQIVSLARTKYAGFNDSHFTEKLIEVEKLEVSRASIQRILRAEGLNSPRSRRPRKHRRRRDRKAQAGLMILWDGSRHDWLEGRGERLCLMGAVDDATSELLPGAHFVSQECSAGYLRVLRAIVHEKGVPVSAYQDFHSSLSRNDGLWSVEEELRGEQLPTHVGRALSELGVEPIFALSPQAKGRVERLWGVLQDRLVSELRLAGARTREEADRVLAAFLPDYNRRFAVKAAEQQPAWRPKRGLDLDRICAFRYQAVVRNDNTVKIANHVIDIPPGPANRSYAQADVEVTQHLDGTWRIYLENRELARADRTTLGELRAIHRRRVYAGRERERKRRPPSHGFEAYRV